MDKERKAIIKNSDMTEDMQQDAINVAKSTHIISKKTSHAILKKNSIENTIPLGIALLEEISDLMSRMKLSILSIFTWDKSLCFCSNPDKRNK